jgi:hypothetical protein
MNRKWLAVASLFATACCVIALPSCGSKQRLVGITVNPSRGIVFGATDPALFAQLTATGIYVHPPATKDITTQVTWTSDVTLVAIVTSSGRVTPNVACGVSNVTASLQTESPSGNIISGTTTITVDGLPSPPCPNATPGK